VFRHRFPRVGGYKWRIIRSVDVVGAIAVFGAILSSVLAILKLRDYAVARPRFDLSCFTGDNIDHIDLRVRAVKRGTAAAYLTMIGFAWVSAGHDGHSWSIASGAGLRELGESAALARTAFRPRRWSRLRSRRPRMMNSLSLASPEAGLPRFMQFEGDMIQEKRCASRLAGIVRILGGPPTFVVAVDSVGRVSWQPVPEVVRKGILATAMDDASRPDVVEPCEEAGGLYAFVGGEMYAVLKDDHFIPRWF
jgi:hypothetical protein